MQVSEIEYEGPPPIDSYGGGGFRLNALGHGAVLRRDEDGRSANAVRHREHD